jgi:hypothetical protein
MCDYRLCVTSLCLCFLCNCSVKAAGGSPQEQGALPLMNATMVYLGGDQVGSATAAARLPSGLLHHVVVLAVVSLALAGALY